MICKLPNGFPACDGDIPKALLDSTHPVHCDGCADVLHLPCGSYVGQPDVPDEERFKLWVRVKDKIYCELCFEDLEDWQKENRDGNNAG